MIIAGALGGNNGGGGGGGGNYNYNYNKYKQQQHTATATPRGASVLCSGKLRLVTLRHSVRKRSGSG